MALADLDNCIITDRSGAGNSRESATHLSSLQILSRAAITQVQIYL